MRKKGNTVTEVMTGSITDGVFPNQSDLGSSEFQTYWEEIHTVVIWTSLFQPHKNIQIINLIYSLCSPPVSFPDSEALPKTVSETLDGQSVFRSGPQMTHWRLMTWQNQSELLGMKLLEVSWTRVKGVLFWHQPYPTVNNDLFLTILFWSQ